MKFIICFCFFCAQIFAQNKLTEVTYKSILNLETLPKKVAEKYNKSQQEALISKYNNYNLLTYTLQYNINESLFFLSDSIIGLYHDVDDNSLQKIIRIESKHKYYKNLSENKSIHENNMGGEKLLITGRFNKFEWKLYKEKKQIGEYVCYKAILTDGQELLGYNKDMVIEAWYAPELPVPFGPFEFEGLPGLILELKLGVKLYYATSIKFKTSNKILPLTHGKVITQEAYSTFLWDFKEKMFNSH